MNPTGNGNRRNAAAAWGFFIPLLLAYQGLFGALLPTPDGHFGHDYSYFLPWLLDGYFWFATNGPLSLPWFTPSFCGGQPAFGDPQSLYFSVPQWLTFAFGPLTAVRLTLPLFAAAGFWGSYLLLRGPFRCSVWAALFGAGLFMFNGFFAHRMLVGHLAMHGVMLVPWVAWLILHAPPDSGNRRILTPGREIALAALLIAYWFHAGMAVMLLPAGLTLLLLLTLHALLYGCLGRGVRRAILAALLGVAIAAAKLAATLSFLDGIERGRPPLPGVEDLATELGALLRALFLPHEGIAEWLQPKIVAARFLFERHEFEYGLTLAPLTISLIALALRALRGSNTDEPDQPGGAGMGVRRGLLSLSILALLAIPLALNLRHPGWSETIASLPLIGDSSSLFRWWFAYLLPLAVAAGVALQSLTRSSRRGATLAALLLSLTVGQHALESRDEYLAQDYSPQAVEAAFDRVRATGTAPPISFLGVHTDETGQPDLPLEANNLLVHGGSPLTCYNPIFGYDLEWLRLSGQVHPGPVLEARNGYLNLPNPACVAYPEANRCEVGALFPEERRAAAERFAARQPFDFEPSTVQRAAGWVTALGLIGALLLLLVPRGRRDRREDRPATP